jgi:uncharacterized membrane protein (UPF0127 family)
MFKNYRKIKTLIKGRGNFTLWVADTSEKKRIGLSMIRRLPKRHGMIFVYNQDVDHAFTMKNTYIPLTIIFLDSKFNVIDSFKCKPLEKRSISPGRKYRYVVEI